MEAVSLQAAEAYGEASPHLIRRVNVTMIRLEKELSLIGDQPASVMFENHENHARFVHSWLLIQDRQLLDSTLDWVVSGYIQRGFSPDYFPYVLTAWEEAVKAVLPADHAGEILQLYTYMRDYTRQAISRISDMPSESPDSKLSPDVQQLVGLLLKGERRAVTRRIRTLIEDSGSVDRVYTEVITRALYEIGRLWEIGRITVAHEHLASSIVIAGISNLYQFLQGESESRGNVLVTSAPNEFHEIGARMVADLLESDGWEVAYLGANTPAEDIIALMRQIPFRAVCVSVAMSFNIPQVLSLIQAIRADSQFDDMSVVVGGYALSRGDYTRRLGADLITNDIGSLLTYIDGASS